MSRRKCLMRTLGHAFSLLQHDIHHKLAHCIEIPIMLQSRIFYACVLGGQAQFELPVISPNFRLMQEPMLPLQTKTLKAKKGGAQRRSLTTRNHQNSPKVQSASGNVSQAHQGWRKQWQFLDSIVQLTTALDMFLSISPKDSATV